MKRVLSIIVTVILVLACFNSCDTSSVDVKAEIEASNLLFMEAVNTGDTDALTSIYLPDATICPPNFESVTGVENIVAVMTSTPAGSMKMVFETISAEAFGNTAIELGNYKVLTPDEAVVLDYGKYIVTWKKQGNDWKVSKDIWNSSKPPIPRAMENDSVLIAITKVKKESEEMVDEFSMEKYLPTYKEFYPDEIPYTRILKTTSPDKNGDIYYFYIVDPLTTSQHHNTLQVLAKKHGEEETRKLLDKYPGLFENQTAYITVQTKW